MHMCEWMCGDVQKHVHIVCEWMCTSMYVNVCEWTYTSECISMCGCA